jgi:CRISPR-associated protein Cmr2
MSKFYLGLTIGPIVSTLQSVRRTNDLWAASYLFSYIMKQMVNALRKEHTFLIPYVKDESLFSEDLGVGLFPDRFILSSENSQLAAVKNLADKTLVEFLNKVDPSVSAWAKDYFKLYVVEIKEIGSTIGRCRNATNFCAWK